MGRDRLVLCIAFTILFSSPSFAKVPVFQGLTTSDQTQITFIEKRKSPYRIQIRSEKAGDSVPVAWEEISPIKDTRYQVRRVGLRKLHLNTDYSIEFQNKWGSLVDQRRFGTVDLTRARARIALVSCTFDIFYNPFIWKALRKKRPDYLFSLGDNVYGDWPHMLFWKPAPPKHLRKRYIKTLRSVPFYGLKRLIPMLSTWDDHDLGYDGAGVDFPHLRHAQTLFETFYLNRPNSFFQRGPGISSVFRAFGQKFFFLDNRSFRTKRGRPDVSQFGHEQEDWMLKGLGRSSEEPVWLLTGDQLFRKGRDPAPGRAQFFKRLGSRARSLVILSGDRHYSEIQAIEPKYFGFPTFEITSSAIHSFPFQLPKNRRRVKGTGVWGHNFLTLDLTVASPLTRVDVGAWGMSGSRKFQFEFDM